MKRKLRLIEKQKLKNGGKEDGIVEKIGKGKWKLKEKKIGEKEVFKRNDR